MESDIALIGDRLQSRFDEISAEMTTVIAAEVVFLDEADMFAMLEASVAGNIDTILQVLRNSIPLEHVQADTAAIEYAYRLAQRGVPADSLRRAYHLGSESLRKQIFFEIQALECSTDTKLHVQHHLDGFLHRYIDWVTQEVLAAHAEESRRRAEHSASATSSLVREVLDGQPVAATEFEARARYRLGQTHRAAVVWVDRANPGVDYTPALSALASRAARSFPRSNTYLFTAVDRGMGWVWFGPGSNERPDSARLAAALEELPGSRISFGSTGEGVAGFRRSHTQAEAAKSVALASRNPTLSTIFYGDPGVAITSVLVRDMPATRAWISEQLHGLAQDSEPAARLRETISILLANESSYTRTAKEMNLHRNTVKYRVEKAIELRGRPLSTAPTDLAMALQVSRILGVAALKNDNDVE